MSDERARRRRAARQAARTAAADQARAAATEQSATLAKVARLLGRRPAVLRHGQAPGVDRMIRRITADLTRCEHLDPNAPEPCWIMASAPGRLMCRGCMSAETDRLADPVALAASEADGCDSCGHPSGHYREVVCQSGPLVITGHLCDGCFNGFDTGTAA